MPGGGILTIETRNVDVQEGDATVQPPPGEYVHLTIGDNGIGMPPDLIEKILDPFFTTKERDKGTGLGLSMVYGFTRRAKGHLVIESEPGKGTIVNLYLPVS